MGYGLLLCTEKPQAILALARFCTVPRFLCFLSTLSGNAEINLYSFKTLSRASEAAKELWHEILRLNPYESRCF